eukprot:CAMPEP_0202690370 /NCGR_PEP_ID=MMETSP1385-20130828/5373_1 /ASSEMBLY_ACC=CAM_ASM_000861 /TAXON_ID=933848 /ORGANISM="Elphidium margaritaceum" /LENGTH=69 /DNA_ID=CAMNT_0049345625 /DNA_START=103 /DNA_END=312 /DNA_ORIENTATION=+
MADPSISKEEEDVLNVILLLVIFTVPTTFVVCWFQLCAKWIKKKIGQGHDPEIDHFDLEPDKGFSDMDE